MDSDHFWPNLDSIGDNCSRNRDMICLISLMMDCLLPNGKRISEVIFSAQTLCTFVTWSTQNFVIENFFFTMELSISTFAFHLHSLFLTYALKATYSSSLKLEKGCLQQPTQSIMPLVLWLLFTEICVCPENFHTSPLRRVISSLTPFPPRDFPFQRASRFSLHSLEFPRFFHFAPHTPWKFQKKKLNLF